MSRRRLHTAAFTTVELLVAISILVILAGLVFVGFKTVGTGGKTRSTKAALESARAMLAEVDAAGGMAGIKSVYTSAYSTTTYLTSPTNSYVALNAFPGSGGTPQPLPAPTANVSEDTYSSTNTQRYTSEAVARTQAVMARLAGSPVNRTILSQIPAQRLLAKPPTTDVVYKNPTAGGAPNPPILVDGWNNPIIYVPPSGLSGVTVAGTANQTITSVRVRSSTYNAGDTNPSSATYGDFSPGATGFWASAGPDGDFTTGDDNVYSFE